MAVTEANYTDNTYTQIIATIDGEEVTVPVKTSNVNYNKILDAIENDNLDFTIQNAV